MSTELDRPELKRIQSDDGVHYRVVGVGKDPKRCFPTVLEDYVNMRIQLHVHFRIVWVGQEHASNFCAIYERDPVFDVVGDVQGAIDTQVGEGLTNGNDPNKGDDSVFIHIPEIVEFPEWVGRRVVSVIWLHIGDCLTDGWGYSPNHAPTAVPELGRVIENWEPGVSKWAARVPDRHQLDQLIERRPHVVDGISGHDSPGDGGWGQKHTQAKDMLSCFRFVINRNSISVSTFDPPSELRDSLIEELKMETRPIQFHPDSIKGVGRLRCKHG